MFEKHNARKLSKINDELFVSVLEYIRAAKHITLIVAKEQRYRNNHEIFYNDGSFGFEI